MAAVIASPSAATLFPGERDLSSYTFEDYEAEFAKRHGATEREKRQALFHKHLQIIREHNADPDKSWFMTVNEFADWSPEEFQSQRTTHRPHPHGLLKAASPNSVPLESLPASFDWRQKSGVVTKPKNQGACGGCWAFSAAETLESFTALATGKAAPELSTQQLISCTPNPDQCGGTGGCSGATQPLAFNYSAQAGLSLAKEYPFEQETGSCDKAKIKPVMQNDGFVSLPKNNYTALMTAVATKGPISISVAAGGMGWQLYGGGILKGGHDFTIDHAVQLVGYGEDNGVMYWTVRNSWGDWGEQGYIRIQRFGEGKEPCGMDNSPQDGMACKGDTKPVKYCGLCGILSDSSYPTGVKAVGDATSVVV